MEAGKARTELGERDGQPVDEVPAFGQFVLNWAALVSRTVHPVKVSIIEAMEWIGEPVSSSELNEMFEEPKSHYLSLVSYHMRNLVDLGAVEKIGDRPIRGALETFYFLTPAMILGQVLK